MPREITDTDREDLALIARIVAGDERAIAELFVVRYGALIRSLAKKFGCDFEDVLQELYLRMMRPGNTWGTLLSWDPSKASFATWISTIVYRMCRHENKRWQARVTPLSPVEKAGQEKGLSFDALLEVLPCLRLSSEDCLALLVLRAEQGYPFKDLARDSLMKEGAAVNAETLKARAAALRQRYRTCRKHLQDCLEGAQG